MANVTSTIQFYLNGAWVNISDVLDSANISLRRGIMGSSPSDRVAAVGTLTFALDNSSHNSGAKEGYYSPDHANKRAYFTDGVAVRWKLVSGATTRYVFYGTISDIEPEPGKYESHRSNIVAEDLMSQLLEAKPLRISVQLNKRTDELVTLLLTNAAITPLSTSFDTCPDVFPYALDGEDDESTAIMTICQKAVQSDASQMYVTGNATNGETLVVRSRTVRAANRATDASLSDTMTGLSIKHGKQNIFNRVVVTISSRKLDTEPVVIWQKPDESEINPGPATVLTAKYVDPNSQAERISLYPASEITPVAGTDYRMSSIPNGSGDDMNADLAVSVTWGGNSADISLTNNGSKTGYINLLNLRGKGMYSYSRFDAVAKDDTSIATYGVRSINFSLPYQTNPNIAYAIANAILAAHKDPVTHVDSLEFIANKSDALMTAALTCDVGSRIFLSETVTGLTGYHFINNVEMYFERGKMLRVVWGLTPAPTGNFWILGNATYSVLGSTTILGFFV